MSLTSFGIVVVFLSSATLVWGQRCPGNWKVHNGACFHYFNETYSWFSAKAVCTVLESFLAEDKDPETHQFLRSILPANNTKAWLGIQDFTEEGVFVWASSRKPVDVAFWNVGQPMDSGEDDCVAIDQSEGGGWYDGSCEDLHLTFICQKLLPEENVIG